MYPICRYTKSISLKYGHLKDPVSSLSGGNQQKVAIAKMLSVNPKLIFLDEPTRGVDVGTKVKIHRVLRELAQSGVGIVVVLSELPELIGLCDRVMVVREGGISGQVSGAKLTEKKLCIWRPLPTLLPRETNEKDQAREFVNSAPAKSPRL